MHAIGAWDGGGDGEQTEGGFIDKNIGGMIYIISFDGAISLGGIIYRLNLPPSIMHGSTELMLVGLSKFFVSDKGTSEADHHDGDDIVLKPEMDTHEDLEATTQRMPC